MTITAFIVCIAIGAGIIALWTDVRFPRLMPWSMRRLLVHVVLAFLCVYVVAPAMRTIMSTGIPGSHIAAVFTIAFPVLVYNFLVGAWLIRLAQASAGGFRA